MTTRWKLIAGVATLIAMAAVFFAGVTHDAAASTPEPGPVSGDRTITVTGTGRVRVDPDTAMISLGVQATAATGAQAMEQLNASSTALTEALIDAGIAEEDIQTTNLSLWSTYGNDGVEITGYQASLSVELTIHGIDEDIAKIGATIDAAQHAAGPGFTIGGVSFSFADPESVLEHARLDAVANARRRAEQYATAAGATLGEVVTIVEQSSTPPIIYGRESLAVDEAAAAGPSISPGQLDLEVQVSATFAIS